MWHTSVKSDPDMSFCLAKTVEIKLKRFSFGTFLHVASIYKQHILFISSQMTWNWNKSTHTHTKIWPGKMTKMYLGSCKNIPTEVFHWRRKGEMCTIWRFSEQRATSSGDILNCSFFNTPLLTWHHPGFTLVHAVLPKRTCKLLKRCAQWSFAMAEPDLKCNI